MSRTLIVPFRYVIIRQFIDSRIVKEQIETRYLPGFRDDLLFDMNVFLKRELERLPGVRYHTEDFEWKETYTATQNKDVEFGFKILTLTCTIQGTIEIRVANDLLTGELLDQIGNVLEDHVTQLDQLYTQDETRYLDFNYTDLRKADLELREKLHLVRELPIPGLPQNMIQQFVGLPSQAVERQHKRLGVPYPEILSTKVLTSNNNPNAETRRLAQEKTRRKRVVQGMIEKDPGVMFQNDITNANIRKYDPKWYQFWKKKPLKRVSNNVKTENWGATQPPQKPWYKFWGGRTRKAVGKRARKTRRA